MTLSQLSTNSPFSILWMLPLAYLMASMAAWPIFRTRLATQWRIAEGMAFLVTLLALSADALVFQQYSSMGQHTDPLGIALLTLISVLGWIIVRYSRSYLEGEPGQQRYIIAMLLTLASVDLVALSDHLGIMVIGWIASSLSLHHLLTFYPNRPAAIIVAHKKFIASRMADVCLIGALSLIYAATGTLSISDISAQLTPGKVLPTSLEIATALIAIAVILKSAQLPIHGWLIQVMEAPTPVSALLHAGVVNLGGFVLIRIGSLLTLAPGVQILLVVIGGGSAILASLVMMTRISIKVRLAWSTCAQMGFMILECGLGLYDLAFLHLFAHSMYKAYAFLSAGDTVGELRLRRLLPAQINVAPIWQAGLRLVAVPISYGLIAASVLVWQQCWPNLSLPTIAAVLLSIGLAPLLWRSHHRASGIARGLISITALVQLYLMWHSAFGNLVHTAAAVSTPMLIVVSTSFSALYVTQVWLQAFPYGRFSNLLYPWVYAGFFLDERFTRLTFRLWPARMPASADAIHQNEQTLKGNQA